MRAFFAKYHGILLTIKILKETKPVIEEYYIQAWPYIIQTQYLPPYLQTFTMSV